MFLDLLKAFDKVSHAHLAMKLKYYGITGKSLEWIQSFLRDRKQCVSVNGQHSDWSDVLSGVPQGSVLGRTLFLLNIYDIADQIQSTVRLFADDSVIYCVIHNQHDIDTLQQDLETICTWARTWKMKFNASKCQHISAMNKLKPRTPDTQLLSKYFKVPRSHPKWHPHVERSYCCLHLQGKQHS